MISPSYYPAMIYGGPTVAIKNLVALLKRNNERVRVFTTNANGKNVFNVKKSETDGVVIRYYRRILGDPLNFAPGLLIDILFMKSNRFVFHIHSWWNFTSVLAFLICKLRGYKIILTPHGTLTSYSLNGKHFYIKNLFRKYISKLIFKNMMFHFSSKYELQEFEKLYFTCNNYIIPNLVQFDYEVINVAERENICKLLYIGRIHSVKNLEQMFRCLSKFNNNSWTFDIYGDGSEEYIATLKNLCYNLKIHDRINFRGWIDNLKIKSVCSNYDLFVLNSLGENFSLSVLEALYNRLIVLVSSNVGLSDYVYKNNLGWVYNGSDGDLVSKLREIFTIDKSQLKFKYNNLIRIKEDFSWGSIYRSYQEMYYKANN